MRVRAASVAIIARREYLVRARTRSFKAATIFLVVADLATRLLGAFGAQAPPVGVVTAMCGVPFFIYLLRMRWRRSAEIR